MGIIARFRYVGLCATIVVVTALCSACGRQHASTSRIAGTLEFVGAAASAPRVPISGTVIVRGANRTYTVRVGSRGHYEVRVPAGTYSITGHSPSYRYPMPCTARNPVVVKKGRTATADVYCQAGI